MPTTPWSTGPAYFDNRDIYILKTLILNSSGLWSSIFFLTPFSVVFPLCQGVLSRISLVTYLMTFCSIITIFLLIGIIRLLVMQGRSLWDQPGIGANEKKFYLFVSPGISGPLVSTALLLSGIVPSWPSTFSWQIGIVGWLPWSFSSSILIPIGWGIWNPSPSPDFLHLPPGFFLEEFRSLYFHPRWWI